MVANLACVVSQITRVPWSQTVLEINSLDHLSTDLVLFSISVYNQYQCLDLIDQPILICNQSA